VSNISEQTSNMKSRLLIVLITSGLATAQQAPTPPTTPSSSTSTPTAQPQPSQNQVASTTPTRPAPMAKSEAEYKDYLAIQNNPSLGDAEAAANAFLAKYPQTELKLALYSSLMQRFQSADNEDKILIYADRVLSEEPENTIALVIAANVLAERTRDTDLARDQRLAKAVEYAERAIASVDRGFVVDARVPAEQRETVKAKLMSLAHAAIGNVKLLQQDYPAAEKQFQESLDISKAFTDALTQYRLAIVQHYQKKFPEAKASAEKAIAAAQTEKNDNVLKLAQEEKVALEKAQ